MFVTKEGLEEIIRDLPAAIINGMAAAQERHGVSIRIASSESGKHLVQISGVFRVSGGTLVAEQMEVTNNDEVTTTDRNTEEIIEEQETTTEELTVTQTSKPREEKITTTQPNVVIESGESGKNEQETNYEREEEG